MAPRVFGFGIFFWRSSFFPSDPIKTLASTKTIPSGSKCQAVARLFFAEPNSWWSQGVLVSQLFAHIDPRLCSRTLMCTQAVLAVSLDALAKSCTNHECRRWLLASVETFCPAQPVNHANAFDGSAGWLLEGYASLSESHRAAHLKSHLQTVKVSDYEVIQVQFFRLKK